MLVKISGLPQFCRQFVKTLGTRQIVLLKGSLGAGKTTFVKECVTQLGGDFADSPTFSIINKYASKMATIYHVDLYRLETEEEIESTGFWDLLTEEQAILFVEWADRIPDSMWPRSWSQVSVQIASTKDSQARDFLIQKI